MFETSNAILTFVGGLLAFIAMAVPMATKLYARYKKVEDKEHFNYRALAIVKFLLILVACLFYFVFHRPVGIVLCAVNAIWSIVDFIRGEGIPTRGEIFFEAVNPPLLVIVLLCHYSFLEIAKQLAK